jgi:hypothetical protein
LSNIPLSIETLLVASSGINEKKPIIRIDEKKGKWGTTTGNSPKAICPS